MPDSLELVFVYGTLRQGASNHWRMEGAEFLGRAVVRARLYRIDWYPGLVLDGDAGEVVGEVYEVSTAQLMQLDEFEGREYQRRETEVMRLEPYFRQRVWLWEYSLEVEEDSRVSGGDWLAASRARLLPLFLWIAWSPVLLLIVLGLLSLVLRDPAPPASSGGGPNWKLLACLGCVPVVMTVGGLLARWRGERPRILGTIIFLLGLASLLVPLVVLLGLKTRFLP